MKDYDVTFMFIGDALFGEFRVVEIFMNFMLINMIWNSVLRIKALYNTVKGNIE